jgi:hypothetical protein
MILEKEYVATNASSITREEQEHNALIKERYNQLRNAVADQFSEQPQIAQQEPNVQASVAASLASVYRPAYDFSSVLDQRPTVTEYINPGIAQAPASEQVTYAQAETYAMPTFIADVAKAPEQTAATQVESYSLSTMAKAAMALFAVVTIGLLAVIGANTQVIQQKERHLQALQQERVELLRQGEDIQRRIEMAKSEETIREYALSQGMIEG